MSKKSKVPDAWDDDWEAQADDLARNEEVQDEVAPGQLSKAEHLAEHQEKNRKLWETAEAPPTFHYLEANSNVPLASGFKPQVKVLSRKPMIAKRDPATGLSSLSMDDDDEGKEPRKTLEEARAKQKRDKEEKERKYEEARAKIFGESAPSSGASSPGTTTPPRSNGRNTPQGRGRGRGGNRGRGGGGRQLAEPRQQGKLPEISGRELYDPNYSPKPESSIRRPPNGDGPALSPQDAANPIRVPRGPDGSGRGGIGFTGRGGSKG